ncbi:SWIM zinc finger family protein [Baekduia sp.]|uniref:SWIM zinc finger family protein n=1 Tax=Baekduia sp. TaxID=2600305 RepID=UPI002D1FBD80|nr:DUF6880 family protein [Baekduia sp.]
MEVLDEEVLAGLAGPRSFARGLGYAADGAVAGLRVAGEVVEATVQGTHAYRVRLGVGTGGRVEHSCSCPAAEDGACCKHCVAVGLRWLRGHDGADEEQVLRAYLHGLGVDGLVDLVVEQAGVDLRFGERLAARALRAADGPVDMGACRALLDRAMRVRGYVDYQEAWGFFQGVEDAIDTIAELLEDGHSGEVVELCEHAAGLLDATVGEVDDSDGGTMDALGRLEELHLAACAGVDVDPVALAERLFSMAMASELDTFSEAPQRYAEILGPEGLARFGELVEKAWAKGEDEESAWLLESWAEQMARQAGDVDRLVAIKSRDLTDDWGYQQVVEVLVEAQWPDEALAWAQRGLDARAVHHQPALRDFVATAYRAGGRLEEAVALRAEQLRDTPSLEAYQALKHDADALGAWPEHRQAALAQLRDTVAPSPKAPRWGRRDRSTLVEIFLWERRRRGVGGGPGRRLLGVAVAPAGPRARQGSPARHGGRLQQARRPDRRRDQQPRLRARGAAARRARAGAARARCRRAPSAGGRGPRALPAQAQLRQAAGPALAGRRVGVKAK